MKQLHFKPFLFVLCLSILLSWTKAHSQVLVVVHPSYEFSTATKPEGQRNGSETAVKEINELVNHFLIKEKPVYILATFPGTSNYTNYVKNIDHTQVIESLSGQNFLKFSDRHIYVAGGFMYACLKRAIEDLIDNNSDQESDLYIHFVLPAVYGKYFSMRYQPELSRRLKNYFQDILDNKIRSGFNRSRVHIDVVTNTTPLN